MGERPRSATLPGDVKFSAFVSNEKDEVKSVELTDGGEKKEKEVKKAKKEKQDKEGDKVFSQGNIGEHKFYSFTKYVDILASINADAIITGERVVMGRHWHWHTSVSTEAY